MRTAVGRIRRKLGDDPLEAGGKIPSRLRKNSSKSSSGLFPVPREERN